MPRVPSVFTSHRISLSTRATAMRHCPTSSEAQLFAAIGGHRLGVSFRRQVPLLGRFIVDFLAPSVRLVVEVDGTYHEERDVPDARRDRALARAGYRVLRLDAALVMSDLEVAVELVKQALVELDRHR